MGKAKRNIGLEILEGIREIKRGEHGRVITLPAVSGYVRAPGFHSRSSLSCLGSRWARCRIGNKVVEPPQELRVHCSGLWLLARTGGKSKLPVPWLGGASSQSSRFM